MTLAELREEVSQNIALEGVTKPPDGDQVIRALNRAKNDAVNLLEQIDPLRFSWRKDYTIAGAQTYIDLPNGSDALYPYCRRVLSVHYVSSAGAESKIGVYDLRDIGEKDSEVPYYLVREGHALYHSSPDGWGSGATIRLRYAASVPDLGKSETNTAFALIPAEWTDLISIQATCDLLPANAPAEAKWIARRNERQAALLSAARFIATGPMRIRRRAEQWDDS